MMLFEGNKKTFCFPSITKPQLALPGSPVPRNFLQDQLPEGEVSFPVGFSSRMRPKDAQQGWKVLPVLSSHQAKGGFLHQGTTARSCCR